MIVSAALCPSPPLLGPGLTGQADILPELREACSAALSALLAARPDMVAVIGPADETAAWDPAARLDLTAYASAVAPAGPRATRDPSLPLALGIGAFLLDEARYAGPRLPQAVAESASPADCARLGRDLAARTGRLALLAVGDGTARRSLSAPGYLDERAEPFDAEVERALRDGDLPALAALPPVMSAELMATHRAPLQVLAGALSGVPASDRSGASVPPVPRRRADILYSAAPFGVAYLVAAVTAPPVPALSQVLQPDG